MDSEYFAKLPADLRGLVFDIEAHIGFEIAVEVDKSRAGESVGHAPLACEANESDARIILPSADYFPEDSVFHELLHIKRFLVDGVPQVSICDSHWRPEYEQFSVKIDNDIEHLSIVPVEIHKRPSRKKYWSFVIEKQIENIGSAQMSIADRDYCAVYANFFAAYVLAEESLRQRLDDLLSSFQLMERALKFNESMLAAIHNKEDMVGVYVESFSLRPECICLDYFDPGEGIVKHVRPLWTPHGLLDDQ